MSCRVLRGWTSGVLPVLLAEEPDTPAWTVDTGRACSGGTYLDPQGRRNRLMLTLERMAVGCYCYHMFYTYIIIDMYMYFVSNTIKQSINSWFLAMIRLFVPSLSNLFYID